MDSRVCGHDGAKREGASSWRHALPRQALWAALTLALGLPAAHAQTTPDGGTHTQVIAAPNGVPVVNIAAPNGAGVSHNTYQQFNVAGNGLIFNNSGAVSNTQLAGYITGNANLGPGQSAQLILNEVTSTQPSQLNGAMEVAGRAAQVVVANPNGITCGGCGFINAPRGTLVTGVPILDANGGLAGFNVSGGTITVNTQGLLSSQTDQVDLLARAVQINAGVWARQLNVVTGSNRIDYATLAAQPINASGATPAMALDVSALGGMYANAIRLIGTEAGLGVNSQGQIAAQNGDLSITSAGQVVLGGKTSATGNLTLQAAQALNNAGTLAAGGALNLNGADVTNSGVLYSGAGMSLSANGQLSNSGQIKVQNGAFTAQASGAVSNSGSLYAGTAINLSGASFGNTGAMEAAQGASLLIGGHADNSGTLQTDAGDLTLNAATLSNSGTLSAKGNTTLVADSALSSIGTTLASGNLLLDSAQLTTAGTVQAGAALSLQGGTLSNSGKLYALGDAWIANLSGAFANQAGGDVYGSQSLAVNAASLNNAGSIEAQQGNAITLAGNLVSSGKLQSDQADLSLRATALTNSGTLSAYRNLQAQVSGATQNSGVLVSGQAVNLTAASFDNQAGGQLQSGTDLSLSAAAQSNEGSILAKGNATLSGTSLSNTGAAQWTTVGTLTLNQSGDVSNAGTLQAGGDLSLLHASSLSNSGTLSSNGNATITLANSLSSTGSLLAGGNMSLTAPQLTTAGTVQAGAALSLSGNTLSNNGKLYALGGAWTTTLTGAFTSQSNGDIYASQGLAITAASLSNAGAIEAQQANTLNLTGAFANSGKLQSDQADVTLKVSALTNSGTLSAAHNLQAQLSGTAQNSGVLVTGQAINLSAAGFDNQAGGQMQSGTDLMLTATSLANEGGINVKGNATLSGTDLSNAGAAQWITAGTLSLNQTGTVSNAGLLQAGGKLDMLHAAALVNSGTLQNGADSLTLSAATLGNTGTLSTNGNAVLTASNSLSSTGSLLAAGDLSLAAPQLTTAGTVQVGAALSLSGATLSNNGKLYALGGAWTASLTGAFTSLANGDIYGSQGLAITAASLSNAGAIEAQQAQAVNLTGAFANSGKLQSDQADVTLKAATLNNTGTLSAAHNLQAQLSGTAQNSGMLVTGQAINLSATGFDNQAGGQLQSGTDLSLSATTLSNEGNINAKGNAALAGTELGNGQGAQWLAGGTLTLSQTGHVDNAGILQAGSDLSLLHAATLSNAGTGTLYAGQDFQLGLSQALSNAGMLYAARTATLSAGSVDNAGTLRSAGTLILGSLGNLVSSGAIQAQQDLSLQSHGDFSNSGQLYAIDGQLGVQISGAFNAAAGSDIYAGQNLTFNAGRFANAGAVEAKQAIGVTAQGSASNSGTLQADNGNLDIADASLDNQGKLSATGAMQLSSTGNASNSGTVVTGQTLALSAASVANGGQIQSSGNATVQAASFTNSGSLQSGGALAFRHNATLTNQAGGKLLAAGDLSADTASLLDNAGIVQGGGNLTISGTGAITNEATGTLYGTELTQLQLGGGFSNAGTAYGAQGFNLSAVSLANSGSLRSGAALGIGTQGDASNSGTAYALGNASWNIGGALANSGVLAAAGNTTLTAGSLSGNGTLAAGLQGDGSLGRSGDLTLTTRGNLADHGHALAAGQLRLSGSAIDLSHSQTRASTMALVATQGDIDNSGGDLAANGLITISTPGSLINAGAKLSAGTLALQAAALNNRYGSVVQTGNSDLNLSLSAALNNAGGTLATNAQNLTLSAASFDNSGGHLQAAGNGTLSLSTAGDLTNNSGSIAGNGMLVLQNGGTLSNNGGQLSAAGDINARANAFSNVAGTLIGRNIGLTIAQALINTQGGTLQAGGALNASAATLDNSGGFIKLTDAQALSLATTGALTNAAGGFIGGNGDVTVSSGSLVNAGQIYAGSNLGVSAQGNLSNDNGALQAQASASIVSGGALSNRAGKIEAGSGNAGATLGIHAASLDNTGGRIANTGQGTSNYAVAQSLLNEGGTLGGQGAVSLSAATLDNNNAGKLVAGQALTLGLGGMSNQGGTVYAAGDINWNNGGAALQNAQGSLETGGNLSVALASLDNSSGTLASNGNGSFNVGSFTGVGKVAAGQNLTLNLGGNYTNALGNQLSANNLTLNIAGNFANATGSTLQASNNLSVSAANIDNAAGATLNSNSTTSLSTGGTLSNEGNIDGSSIALNAGTLSNTANIIGGSITATAWDLTNGTDQGQNTGNNPYQSAMIAGSNSVALYVGGTLLNRDATIFTVGDLSIAGNTSGAATQAVTNLSGDIEANGSVAISANQFTNQRRVFQTTTYNLTAGEQAQNTATGAPQAVYRYDDPDPTHKPPYVAASQVLTPAQQNALESFCGAQSNPGDDNGQWCNGSPINGDTHNLLHNDLQSITTATLTAVQRLAAASAQSKLMAGGNITLNGSVLNDKSTIAAGNNLIVNGQNGSNGGGATGSYTVQNIAFTPTGTLSESINEQTGIEYVSFSGGRHWAFKGYQTWGVYQASVQTGLGAGQPSWIGYDAGPALAGVMSAGNTVAITAQTITNSTVDANGNPVQNVIGLGGNSAGQAVGGSGAATVGSATGTGGGVGNIGIGALPGQANGNALDLASAHSVGIGAIQAPGQTQGAQLGQANSHGAGSGSNLKTPGAGLTPGASSTPSSAAAPVATAGHTALAPPQVVSTLVGPNATINLPQTGLYSLNVQPGSSFLVETNPQFTQYNHFISSDYMLQKLALDPQQIQQRLGDGFYEQQRVLDQITELTGRRYLTDASDALDQYRNLMNNAVQVAQQFHLSVGVALTPEQMANLTQDIVWLVSVNVDGHQVLEPVVYLSAADAKNLAANGATIAGKNVILTASGDITNNGSIEASQNAQLTANNLLNSGTISAGNNLSLTAAQNILNGGSIKAGGNVSLVAGGDVLSGVNVAQSLGAVQVSGLSSQLSPVALSNLALPGSISAGGSLAISAGRDLQLDTAPIAAGGNLSLAAGRDLSATATAISAGGSAQLLAGRDLSLLATGTTTHVGTQRNGTDALTHTVSTLTAGGGVTLLAGRDVTSQGAQLTGSTVALGAGRDINLQAVTDSTTRSTDHFQNHTETSTGQTDQQVRGTSLTGNQGISLAAARDLTITAGNLNSAAGNVTLSAGHNLNLNAAQEDHSSYSETSMHQSGLFSSSSTHTLDASHDSNAVGTNISGNNVSLAAGNNLTTQAAQLTANQGLTLSAVNNVTLGAGQQTHSEEHDYEHSSFNFFSDSSKRFGSVDPEWRSHQSSTTVQQTHSVGSILSGDTVTVAAGHDLTGTAVQIAGTHDVTLAAGNNLTLDAGKNTYEETQSSGTSHTGLMNGGGFSVLIGKKSQKTTTTDKEVSYTGSLVGSTDGAVTLTAGNNVHITGSDVLSQTATTIVGKNVTIDAAVGSQDITQTQKQSSAGINVGLGGKVAEVSNSAYYSVQRASEVKDDRLKALYAAQAAYAVNDVVKMAGTSLGQAASKTNQNGIDLQVGIGGSSASSTTTSHDDKAYGSSIHSAGDVTIAATGGDLNIVGSKIDGKDVALAASHDINVLSQAEDHSLKSSNKNASGGVGIQIGSDGVGFYAQGSAGKGSAHGNGVTHADSVVNATDNLTLVSGNDTTIKGAQLTGNTVLGTVGNNLVIQSEQDTNDYASKQQQLGGKVVIGYGSGGSLSYNQTDINSNYRSVTDVSGIQAGSGGFDIAVGGNTHLIGGVIASTADASKNLLDTGGLAYDSIHNEAKYSASSVGISGGYGAGSSMGSNILSGVGTALSLATPQHGNSSSDTQSGIAQGTINVRDGHADLSGLDRDPKLGNQALKPIFDAQKVQENIELGQVAGQVGMRAAGGIAQYMANHATTEADKASWSDGGANKVMLHGLVGAATAALGGGDALQGALGAMASEKASAAMQQYLDDHNITDPAQRNTLMQLASVAIGGVVGGGSGAATALQGEQYNRELHDLPDQNEKARIKDLAGGDPKREAELSAAACALVHCSAEYAVGSPEYALYSQLEALGNQPEYAADRALLLQQTQTSDLTMKDGGQIPVTRDLFQYTWTDKGSDDLTWINNSYGHPFTRLGGGLQAFAGGTTMITGGSLALGGAASCAETLGAGCGVAAGGTLLVGWGADQLQAGGRTMWNGTATRTVGGQLLQDAFGISPQGAEFLYGMGGGVASLAADGSTLANTATNVANTAKVEPNVAAASAQADAEAGTSTKNFTQQYGSIIPNAMKPHEIDQVQQFLTDMGGGTFNGVDALTPGEQLNGTTVTSADYPVIDGTFSPLGGSSVPVSLKELTSSNPLRILKEVDAANDTGLDFHLSNVTMVIDAPNMTMDQVTNFANNGRLTGSALRQGVIDTVVVKTSSGYVTIANGTVSSGVPKGWVK